MADELTTRVIEIILQAKSQMKDGLNAAASDLEGFRGTLSSIGTDMMKSGGILLGADAAIVGVGLAAVKAAGDYQELTTALVTGAGESKANIDQVIQGMLDMSREVGVSADDLAKGMYMIESAGFHGADGLKVLEASAEGAKIGLAKQEVVADALTTVLKDYKLSSDQAIGVTGQMTATVAAGKMHWDDFASSLSKVLPIASALNIPFQQVAAAEAVMTAHGVDAARATTAIQGGLMQLIEGLKNSEDAFKSLGINTGEMRTRLASGDLTGALDMIATAMQEKLPAGAREAMAQVQQAMKDGLDPEEAMKQFQAKAGPQYAEIVSNVVKGFGGVRGGALALNLLPNMEEYKADVASIGTVTEGAAKEQEAWAEVQKDLNYQLAVAKANLSANAIELGQALLPAVVILVQAITPLLKNLGDWISTHKELIAQYGPIVVVSLGIAGVILVVAGAFAILAAAASPVTLIILGIAAVIAAGIYIWTHWTEITQFLTEKVKDARDWLNNLHDRVGPLMDVVLALSGPIGWAIEVFMRWDEIVKGFNQTLDWLRDKLSFLAGPLGAVKDALGGAIGAVLQAGAPQNTVPANAFSAVGTLPAYASGGIAWTPQIASVGESGPEAIIPLSRMGSGSGGAVSISVIVSEGAVSVNGGADNGLGQRLGDGISHFLEEFVRAEVRTSVGSQSLLPGNP